ncbi:RsmB/NOP family class I SAM-dependent RNA methyltransferase [Alphaproteobacteria bacterium]|nr:RsmB/NOP family class I SAM-dependent RNA methyltransferase [Alphaproteobacteria bacterium]
MTHKAIISRNEFEANSAIEAVLARYADIAGDRDAFAASLSRPLKPCVWANPLRLTRERLATLLADENISSEAVEWSDTALRLDVDSRPGLSWLYRAGLIQIQEESAMLSVHLLDPNPGECILDLCAAPGNKTAQIATALANRGTVVANDRNVGRLAALHATISRLGLMNVTTTAHNGVAYRAANASFDKVLVDVPCSGEGTIRKGIGKHKPISDGFRHWLKGTQRALLNRAVDLCRSGGRIVYSTCTLSPDENEAIVDQILTARPNDLQVVATNVPGLRASPGATRWRDVTYDKAIARSVRLWPHITDTSGFFAVLFERTRSPNETPVRNAPMRSNNGMSVQLDRFIEHFGFPEAIFDQCCIIGGSNQRRLVANDHCLPEIPQAMATGLALTRDKAKNPKLSTQAALAFGDSATRNAIDLNRGEVKIYMSRGSINIAPDRISACAGPGHVLARYQGFALGIASLHRDNKLWILDSLFPKG